VKYYAAPLYHLFVVYAADLFNSSLRTALYATLGLVMPITVLLVYFVSRHFLPVRWALFATAAYGVADHVIRWGLHVIPTAMGLVFFIAVCYGIVKIDASPRSNVMYVFTLFFLLAITLTHQVSTFITVVVLGAGTAAQLYLWLLDFWGDRSLTGSVATSTGERVNVAAFFAFGLPVTFISWSVTPSSDATFLDRSLILLRQTINSAGLAQLASETATASGAVESMLVAIPVAHQLLDALGLLLFLLVAFIGVFTVLRWGELDLLALMWVFSFGVTLFVTLVFPLLGIQALLPTRWYAFMYVPIVILGAAGLQHLEFNLPGTQLLALLLVIALLLPGAMLADGKATLDDPIDQQYNDQYAYSSSELAAAETIAGLHPDEVVLGADHPYHLLFRDWQHEETEPLELADNGTTTNDHVIYRESQTSHGVQVAFGESFVRAKLPPAAVCRQSMDVVYSNGEVRYCREV
jgi:hypothetical protein